MNEEPTQPTADQSARPPLENLLGKRMLAGIIDLIVIIVIGAIMTALFGDFGSDNGNGDGNGFNASLTGLPFVVFVLLSFGYYFLLESASGQTLGKMALGIKVVSVTGERASPGSIAIRTILRIIDGFFFYLVAVLIIALSGRHQRLGDMAANTVVVSAPRP